jgi:hypothetical protein
MLLRAEQPTVAHPMLEPRHGGQLVGARMRHASLHITPQIERIAVLLLGMIGVGSTAGRFFLGSPADRKGGGRRWWRCSWAWRSP